MKTLIVYDSVHGNTQQLAEEILHVLMGELKEQGDVRLKRTDEFTLDELADVDLLILGGPVRRHTVSPAIAKLLTEMPSCALHGIAVAAFDTRYALSAGLSGSVASKMARLLRRLGARQVVQSESFTIDGKLGPLRAGELERAERWAQNILEKMNIIQ
jgi:flavodoxin